MSPIRAILAICVTGLMGATLCGCQSGPKSTEGASASEARPTTLRVDESFCRRFRSLRGGDRIAEGRAVYEQMLPQPIVLGRGVDGPVRDPSRRTFDVSRDRLIDLLGEPDAQTDELITYELGAIHGRRHVLQIAIVDGQVGASNLSVWF